MKLTESMLNFMKMVGIGLISNGTFKTGRISKLKSGTKVTVTETMKNAGKNQLITVIKVK